MILVLLFLGFKILGQQYIPFPTNNAKWREYHTQCGCKKNVQITILFQESDYILNGDTLINDTIYHKLYRSLISGEDYPYGPYGGPFTMIYGESFDILHGFMREENKQIYFKEINQLFEQKLYDFNLNIGDSINGLYPIINVDSVNIGNIYRKRYLISAYTFDSLYFIEGIGSTSGLFPSFEEFENSDDLTCFSQNNQLVWHSSTMESRTPCDYVLTNSIIEKQEFKVYPNPVNDELIIENNQQINSIIELTDLLGQIILIQKLNNYTQRINLSTLKKGIYILKIKNKNFVQQIIKL